MKPLEWTAHHLLADREPWEPALNANESTLNAVRAISGRGFINEGEGARLSGLSVSTFAMRMRAALALGYALNTEDVNGNVLWRGLNIWNTKPDVWHRYEEEKAELRARRLTPEQYQSEIRRLVDSLGV